MLVDGEPKGEWNVTLYVGRWTKTMTVRGEKTVYITLDTGHYSVYAEARPPQGGASFRSSTVEITVTAPTREPSYLALLAILPIIGVIAALALLIRKRRRPPTAPAPEKEEEAVEELPPPPPSA